MISKDTATGIALAYREVETAEALLKLGRQRGLQLGVPSGDNAHRLFDVPWSMAKPIIETHIATQKALIAALTEQAMVEAKEGASNG